MSTELTEEKLETGTAEAPASEEITPPKPKLTSAEKLARLQERYTERLKELEDSPDPIYAQAVELCERLMGEINVLGVYRMIELFGYELVDQKATEAIILFKRALKGPKKFPPAKQGTEISTADGKLRTCGGIFFYLMNQHARSQGYSWEQTAPVWYPWEVSHKIKLPKKPEKPKETRRDKRRR